MKKILKWLPAILILACIASAISTNESKQQSNTTQAEVEITSENDVQEESVSESMESSIETDSSTTEYETADTTEQYLYGSTISTQFDINTIPTYTDTAYVEVNGNIPYFIDEELTTTPFENYSELDSLGRCGVAYANICKEIMPTDERGKIGEVKPTGWHLVKYDIVDGNYLYNRCHLIGYQLAGENANVQNLITGTRYLNVTGMLPFEDMVAKYVNETDNHVLYRITPIFSDDNLLADGVLMEAKSVEDNGEGICFNVFCYNVQPGITIDYATGDSTLSVTTATTENNSNNSTEKNTTQNIETSKTTEPEVTNKEQEQQSVSEQAQTLSTSTIKYAVNAKNGKIHIVGACPATKEGDNAMKEPVYFDTYEDAEAYSVSIAPSQDKRNCGNCW